MVDHLGWGSWFGVSRNRLQGISGEKIDLFNGQLCLMKVADIFYKLPTAYCTSVYLVHGQKNLSSWIWKNLQPSNCKSKISPCLFYNSTTQTNNCAAYAKPAKCWGETRLKMAQFSGSSRTDSSCENSLRVQVKPNFGARILEMTWGRWDPFSQLFVTH